MIDFTRFVERYEQLNSLLRPPENIVEKQLNELYIKAYKPKTTVDEVLIVYHGGGFNSDAGYEIFARQLSYTLPVCVCLLDIRGHGRSAGIRGDASSPDQIWRNVDAVIDYVRACFIDARIHLPGHSSGGGMLINYLTKHSLSRVVESLILLAPALGPFSPSNLNRDFSIPFASVNHWPFIINAVSAGFLCGRRKGVKLHFPCEIINSRPDFVQVYSVNMANALTPRNPEKQLREISSPVKIMLAEHDELFDVSRMDEFFRSCTNPNISCQVVENSTHLDCIFEITDIIREHFTDLASKM